MTVGCNVLDCGYNTEGICCQKYIITIVNGQCSWLINNPNYRIRGPIQECSVCESKADITVKPKAIDPEEDTPKVEEKLKRKYTKKKTGGKK